MEKEIDVWLSDIKQAITEIDQFLPAHKSFSAFQNDLIHNPKIEISSSRKIVDTRNRISHGYDSVSDDIIWAIVIRDLPKLKEEIEFLLKK